MTPSPNGDPCPYCGTWVCDRCHWSRNGANRFAVQTCHFCRSPYGSWLPIRHVNPGKREDHEIAAKTMQEHHRRLTDDQESR